MFVKGSRCNYRHVHFPGEDSGSQRGSDLPKSTKVTGREGYSRPPVWSATTEGHLRSPLPREEWAASPRSKTTQTGAGHVGPAPRKPPSHTAFKEEFRAREAVSEYWNESVWARRGLLILLFFKASAEPSEVICLTGLP